MSKIITQDLQPYNLQWLYNRDAFQFHQIPLRNLHWRFAMKFMTTWSAKPGAFPEAVRRFLAGEGTPGEGVTLLGRWHSADFTGGFSLFETSDPAALYASASPWADILDLKTVVVVEDADAGPVLAKLGRK
jgi:hypothetical protein